MTEVTKKGTPHHHLVSGTVGDSVRCYGRSFVVRKFVERFDSCDCLSHTLSREWKEVTGDSYICHTVPVVGGNPAGAYMAKYLTKTFGSESRLEAVGMSRRWSNSKGWPGRGRLQLAQTQGAGYRDRSFQYGHHGREEVGELTERVGNPVAIEMGAKKHTIGIGKKLVKISDVYKDVRA